MDLQKGFSETLCCPTTAPTTSLFPIYSRFNVHQRSLTPSSFPFPGDLILTVPIRMPWAGIMENFGPLLSVPGNSYVMRSAVRNVIPLFQDQEGLDPVALSPTAHITVIGHAYLADQRIGGTRSLTGSRDQGICGVVFGNRPG